MRLQSIHYLRFYVPAGNKSIGLYLLEKGGFYFTLLGSIHAAWVEPASLERYYHIGIHTTNLWW